MPPSRGSRCLPSGAVFTAFLPQAVCWREGCPAGPSGGMPSVGSPAFFQLTASGLTSCRCRTDFCKTSPPPLLCDALLGYLGDPQPPPRSLSRLSEQSTPGKGHLRSQLPMISISVRHRLSLWVPFIFEVKEEIRTHGFLTIRGLKLIFSSIFLPGLLLSIPFFLRWSLQMTSQSFELTSEVGAAFEPRGPRLETLSLLPAGCRIVTSPLHQFPPSQNDSGDACLWAALRVKGEDVCEVPCPALLARGVGTKYEFFLSHPNY